VDGWKKVTDEQYRLCEVREKQLAQKAMKGTEILPHGSSLKLCHGK